nr:LCP family protein [Clostridia bacterium]
MSAIKNFIVTFFISVLIFGLLAYFILNVADETILAPDDDPSQSEQNSQGIPLVTDSKQQGSLETDAEGNLIFYEINSESFTVLLLGTDYQPDMLFDYDLTILNEREKKDIFPYKERIVSADAIVLMRIDRENKEFVICSIPGSTRVMSDGVAQSLGSLYDSKGIDYMVNKVTAMTGLKIDYYAAMSLSDFGAIIDSVGGITYNVPCDMHYEDASQGLIISLERGLTNLSGEKALQMLRFDGYEDGVTTRASVMSGFAKSLLDKLTGAEFLSQALSFYQLWKAGIETNFTEKDLTDHIDIIFAYPSFS